MTTTRKTTKTPVRVQEPAVLVHPAEKAGMAVHQAAEAAVGTVIDTAKDVVSLVGTGAGYVGHFFKGLVKGH